jgi:hypothetical protein
MRCSTRLSHIGRTAVVNKPKILNWNFELPSISMSLNEFSYEIFSDLFIDLNPQSLERAVYSNGIAFYCHFPYSIHRMNKVGAPGFEPGSLLDVSQTIYQLIYAPVK